MNNGTFLAASSEQQHFERLLRVTWARLLLVTVFQEIDYCYKRFNDRNAHRTSPGSYFSLIRKKYEWAFELNSNLNETSVSTHNVFQNLRIFKSCIGTLNLAGFCYQIICYISYSAIKLTWVNFLLSFWKALTRAI